MPRVSGSDLRPNQKHWYDQVRPGIETHKSIFLEMCSSMTSEVYGGLIQESAYIVLMYEFLVRTANCTTN